MPYCSRQKTEEVGIISRTMPELHRRTAVGRVVYEGLPPHELAVFGRVDCQKAILWSILEWFLVAGDIDQPYCLHQERASSHASRSVEGTSRTRPDNLNTSV